MGMEIILKTIKPKKFLILKLKMIFQNKNNENIGMKTIKNKRRY